MAKVIISQSSLPFVQTFESTTASPIYDKTIRFRYRIVNRNRNLYSDWSIINYAEQKTLLEQVDNGLPRGGNTGDIPVKLGPGDYDVGWVPPSATVVSGGGVTTGSPQLLPPGGDLGEALVKASGTDYDVMWDTVQSLPIGGGSGQALVKNTATDYDASWQDVSVSPQDANIVIGLSAFA